MRVVDPVFALILSSLFFYSLHRQLFYCVLALSQFLFTYFPYCFPIFLIVIPIWGFALPGVNQLPLPLFCCRSPLKKRKYIRIIISVYLSLISVNQNNKRKRPVLHVHIPSSILSSNIRSLNKLIRFVPLPPPVELWTWLLFLLAAVRHHEVGREGLLWRIIIWRGIVDTERGKFNPVWILHNKSSLLFHLLTQQVKTEKTEKQRKVFFKRKIQPVRT